MNEVQKNINEAFEYMRAIPVTGDAVELMAAAKDALRRAYKLAEDNPEKTSDSNTLSFTGGEMGKTNG